jgi:hypothetical protein
MSCRVVFLMAFLSVAFFLSSSPASPQGGAPRDPQAVVAVNAAVAALDGGTTVVDMTLQATVAYVAGSDQESGTATLQAKVGGPGNGGNKSKLALNLSGGQRQEIRNGPAGAWMGPDGTTHSMSTHNCWGEAAWFAPGLALQAALNDPSVGMTWVGQGTYGSAAVQHLQLFRLVAGPSAQTTVFIQTLSTMDVYLDATTALPAAVGFNTHSDADAGTNIPVAILFGNYQPVGSSAGGIAAPLHVQKLLQGSVMLDVSVSSVAINSGVPDGSFNLRTSAGS